MQDHYGPRRDRLSSGDSHPVNPPPSKRWLLWFMLIPALLLIGGILVVAGAFG